MGTGCLTFYAYALDYNGPFNCPPSQESTLQYLTGGVIPAVLLIVVVVVAVCKIRNNRTAAKQQSFLSTAKTTNNLTPFPAQTIQPFKEEQRNMNHSSPNQQDNNLKGNETGEHNGGYLEIIPDDVIRPNEADSHGIPGHLDTKC